MPSKDLLRGHPGTIPPRRLFFLVPAALVTISCLLASHTNPFNALSNIILHALLWMLAFGLLITFPHGIPFRHGAAWILLIALSARIALLPQPPSDDMNRYLWEGRVVQHNISPYRHAPGDPLLAPLAGTDPYFAGINHPDMPAAYPPMILFLFAAVSRLAYHPMSIKLLIVLFDLGGLAVLLAILHRRRLAPQWAFLHGLNPVVLFSFAGQAHFDSIQAFFLLTAIWMYDRRQWVLMFLAAGLAVQSKYVAVLALPLLLRRDNWQHAWVALLAIALPAIPYLVSDGPLLWHSLARFSTDFAFNGSIHALALPLLGQAGATRLSQVSFLILAILATGCFHPQRRTRFRDDPVPGCLFLLGALLLLSPTVHFWYLTWLLPLAIIRPTASWLLLSLTISACFVPVELQHRMGAWRLPAWLQVAEWAPVCLLLLREAWLAVQRHRSARCLSPTGDPSAPGLDSSISVIIPTLNEAAHIDSCIRTAQQDPAVGEVIVVDGGSADSTASIAATAGARVIVHTDPPGAGGGRGGQIRAGLDAARDDIVAILHADVTAPPGTFTHIRDALDRQPDVIGGSVGGRFGERGLRFRLLDIANDFRAACLGIAFGDQLQFFRREPVVHAGIFPAIPLMEDVELSLRLQRLGRTVYLFGETQPSARQWQAGARQRVGIVIRLTSTHLWKRLWKAPDAAAMYQQYYGQ